MNCQSNPNTDAYLLYSRRGICDDGICSICWSELPTEERRRFTLFFINSPTECHAPLKSIRHENCRVQIVDAHTKRACRFVGTHVVDMKTTRDYTVRIHTGSSSDSYFSFDEMTVAGKRVDVAYSSSPRLFNGRETIIEGWKRDAKSSFCFTVPDTESQNCLNEIVIKLQRYSLAERTPVITYSSPEPDPNTSRAERSTPLTYSALTPLRQDGISVTGNHKVPTFATRAIHSIPTPFGDPVCFTIQLVTSSTREELLAAKSATEKRERIEYSREKARHSCVELAKAAMDAAETTAKTPEQSLAALAHAREYLDLAEQAVNAWVAL